MILCIDIGGTKTEIATLNTRGKILGSLRFPTSPDEFRFFSDLTQSINKNFPLRKVKAISIAAPGPVSRNKILWLGNLPWKSLDIVSGLKKLFKLPTYLENDANLAGLYVARHLHGRSIYLTFSTGIGAGIIKNGKIDPAFRHYEPGHTKVRWGKKSLEWEDLASAKAVSEHYDSRVDEITDPSAPTDIAARISIGLVPVITETNPKTLILGGPLGRQLPLYKAPLIESLRSALPPTIILPKIIPAAENNPVIHGCHLNAINNLK